ncbi:GyrI-like domain-containing protein [Nocardia sp. NPDC005366]|uniref:GyrI-like domain-containing protein n=1 Tax=Nocardia sp. NPDC005366 TaxID=3156878 RepID=UPI0033AC36FD
MTDDITVDPAAGPEMLEVGEAITAIVRAEVALTGLRDFFDASFRVLPEVIAAQQAAIVGPPFGLFRAVSDESMDLEVGFPVDRVLRPQRGVVSGHLPAGRIARVEHVGGFDELAAAWERLRSWIGEKGQVAGPLRWEVYHTRPTPDMDPSGLRTELNWLLVPS